MHAVLEQHLNDKAPGGAGQLALVVRLLGPALDVSASLLTDLPHRSTRWPCHKLCKLMIIHAGIQVPV